MSSSGNGNRRYFYPCKKIKQSNAAQQILFILNMPRSKGFSWWT